MFIVGVNWWVLCENKQNTYNEIQSSLSDNLNLKFIST